MTNLSEIKKNETRNCRLFVSERVGSITSYSVQNIGTLQRPCQFDAALALITNHSLRALSIDDCWRNFSTTHDLARLWHQTGCQSALIGSKNSYPQVALCGSGCAADAQRMRSGVEACYTTLCSRRQVPPFVQEGTWSPNDLMLCGILSEGP